MTFDRRYPLHWPEGWPRTPAWKRKTAPFKVTPAQARDEMLRELELLGARDTNISSDQRLNRDGSLSATRYQLVDPGVAIYFRRKGVDVVLACDQYADLHANIRAIGKTIEAMRGIERWGASDMLDRAFTGFAALAAPEQWWQVLGVSQTATTAEVDAAWRRAMQTAHPDKPGGSDAAAARLNKARDDARASRTYNL